MASVSDRLGRLEGRRKPPVPPAPPALTLVMKLLDRDREEAGGGPPLDLTPEEEAAEREATRNALPWLLSQREMAHPSIRPHLDEWIEETRDEIAKLDGEAALESRPKAGAKRGRRRYGS